MTYIGVSGPKQRLAHLAGAFLCLTLIACGGSPSESDGDGGAGGLGGGPVGCIVRNFGGEPDLLFFPAIEALTTAPGSTVEFRIFVDDETRLVKATLMDAWRLRDATPQSPSETVMVPTAGDTILDLAIPIQTTGRYYVDLELCDSNCDELRVVYTLNRANAGAESNAIRDPYERIVYVGNVEAKSTFTCDNPDSVAVQ